MSIRIESLEKMQCKEIARKVKRTWERNLDYTKYLYECYAAEMVTEGCYKDLLTRMNAINYNCAALLDRLEVYIDGKAD